VEGLQEASKVASEVGVNLSLEPMRSEYKDEWCFINDIPQSLQLIEDVGGGMKILYDTWHLWDTQDVVPLTREYAGLVAGVQIADYREPTRVMLDRVLPGDGVIDFHAIIGALEDGGFDGWYDLEVFSSTELPDSIWKRPQAEWVAEGRDKFFKIWGEVVAG
jgi:sugar phosphate isomerase/epimerase